MDRCCATGALRRPVLHLPGSREEGAPLNQPSVGLSIHLGLKDKVRVMAPLQGPPPLQELSGAGQGEQRVDGVSTDSSSFSGWRGGGGGGPRGSQAEAQSPCGQLQSPGDRMSNALNFIWKERGYAMGFAEN